MAKTDNSYLAQKVRLRELAIDMVGKDSVFILDCFAGDGLTYKTLKTDKTLKVVGIDAKRKAKGAQYIGDNRRWLARLDLGKYDIIDLDDYAVPIEQLKIIRRRGWSGIITATMIDSVFAPAKEALLGEFGLRHKGANRALYMRSSRKYMHWWLYRNNVREVHEYLVHSHGVKSYFLFAADWAGYE